VEFFAVSKFWCLLFLSVPVLGIAVFVAAPAFNHWLPRDVSSHGHMIDHLWTFILFLTGAVFLATEGVLFWFLWKYDGKANRARPKFTHGSHNLEVVWTILPAATLLFIAIYQMNAWAEVKINQPNIPPTVQVTARQFEWRLRYPGPDGLIGTRDDIHHVNDLHIPVDTDVLIELKSMDVLHSFFLPNLRVKQDAVPGSKIPVWFRATEVGTYDLVCAELCGWGHYKMKGRLTVESADAFAAWQKQKIAEQEATQ
jgi:cytochrome c oxidase subunit II